MSNNLASQDLPSVADHDPPLCTPCPICRDAVIPPSKFCSVLCQGLSLINDLHTAAQKQGKTGEARGLASAVQVLCELHPRLDRAPAGLRHPLIAAKVVGHA